MGIKMHRGNVSCQGHRCTVSDTLKIMILYMKGKGDEFLIWGKLFLAIKSGPRGKARHGSPELDFRTLGFPL